MTWFTAVATADDCTTIKKKEEVALSWYHVIALVQQDFDSCVPNMDEQIVSPELTNTQINYAGPSNLHMGFCAC